ncbi:MAG: ABC transporter substrate-binding protein [Christensenellales bacterium]|jgi:NitT/TauT family transport system substrate-binding protein
MRKKFARGMAVCAATVLLLAGCGSAAPASKNPAPAPKISSASGEAVATLRVGMAGKDIKTACIILAKELGYYEEEGIEVAFETISNLSEGMTAVDMGKLDVLPFGVIPSATFVSQGSDVVVFGGTIAEGSEIVVLPENAGSVHTLEDFRGKRVGCYRMETGHMVTKGLLRQAGFDLEEDVEFVLLDSQQTIIEAVRKGEVDMGFLNSGQGYVAMQAGLVVEKRVGELAPNFPCCRQTTSRKVLDTRRDDLVKFQIANLRAYDVYLNDKQTAIAKLAAYSGQHETYAEAVLYGLDGTYENAMIVSLAPEKEKVVEFYQTMEANGDIATGKDMAEHVDTEVYAQALHTIAEREPDNQTYQTLLQELEE